MEGVVLAQYASAKQTIRKPHDAISSPYQPPLPWSAYRYLRHNNYVQGTMSSPGARRQTQPYCTRTQLEAHCLPYMCYAQHDIVHNRCNHRSIRMSCTLPSGDLHVLYQLRHSLHSYAAASTDSPPLFPLPRPTPSPTCNCLARPPTRLCFLRQVRLSGLLMPRPQYLMQGPRNT